LTDRGPFRLSHPDHDPGLYVAEILGVLGDQDPLPILEELVPWLRRELASIDPAVLGRRESPDGWSVAEVVLHLTDSELIYRYRMRKIVAEPGSDMASYNQDRWVTQLRYADASVPDALEELAALRKANLAWLRDLTREERLRWGVHDKRGEESVERLVRILASHDIVHRRQIERIRRAAEAAGPPGP
jgi:uncharacterized damage-inducible protein DinB